MQQLSPTETQEFVADVMIGGNTWDNNYVQKQNLKKLRTFDDDPIKAKLQAALRSGLLTANKIAAKEVGGIQRKKSKNKINVAAMKTTLQNIPQEVIQRKLSAAEKKANTMAKLDIIHDQLQQTFSEKQQIPISEPSMKEIFDLLTQMNQRLAAQEQRNVVPYIGPKQPETSLTSRLERAFSNNKGSIFVYLETVEHISKMAFRIPQTSANGGLGELLQNIAREWTKTTLQAITDVLLRTLNIAKNLNGLFTSGLFLNFSNVYDFMEKLLVDIGVLVIAGLWITVNVNIAWILVKAADVLFSTDFASPFGIIVDEWINFMWSIFMDAFLLPMRILYYMFTGESDIADDATAWDILFNKNDKDARLWYVVKHFMDSISSYAAVFLDRLKTKGAGFRFGINSVQSIWQVLHYLFRQIKELMDMGIESAEFVVENMPKFAKIVAQQVIRNLRQVPNIIASGYEAVRNSVFTPLMRLAGGVGQHTLAAPNGVYDALAVCELLNVSMAELQCMKNKQVVHYALNNRGMTSVETFFVAYELNKELIKVPNLKF